MESVFSKQISTPTAIALGGSCKLFLGELIELGTTLFWFGSSFTRLSSCTNHDRQQGWSANPRTSRRCISHASARWKNFVQNCCWSEKAVEAAYGMFGEQLQQLGRVRCVAHSSAGAAVAAAFNFAHSIAFSTGSTWGALHWSNSENTSAIGFVLSFSIAAEESGWTLYRGAGGYRKFGPGLNVTVPPMYNDAAA